MVGNMFKIRWIVLLSIILLVLGFAMSANCQGKIKNGGMDGEAVDQSDGKGEFMLPSGWTKVNVKEGTSDRISVIDSDRPGGGQCLLIKTQRGGVYQTVTPLKKDSIYLITAMVKRVSGAVRIEAYSHNWGPSLMTRLDSDSTGWSKITAILHTVDDGAHIYFESYRGAEYCLDDVEVTLAPIQVSAPKPRPYDFSGKWSYESKLTIDRSTSLPASAVAMAVNNAGKVLSDPTPVNLGANASAAVVINIPNNIADSFNVVIMDSETKAYLGASLQVDTAESPFVINFPYKNSLYATTNYSYPIRVRLTNDTTISLDQLKVRVRITDSNAKVVSQITGRLRGDAIVANIDGSKLPEGKYSLNLLMSDKNDRVLYDITKPLRVLPKGENEVVVDAEENTLINGKKFFPIGLYWVLENPAGWKPGPARKTEDMLELRKTGFNTIHSYQFEHDTIHNTDENALAYLDMAQELGFKVMMGMRRGWCRGDILNEEAIKTRVNRLKNHPALLCWTTWDEPDGNIANLPRVQAMYDIVDELDPYHPVMPVFMLDGGRAFRDATDINLTDYYPGRGKTNFVPDVLAKAKMAIPDKALWFVAQAFEFPTEDDMRITWNYALAANAKAIFWYSYGGDAKDWDSIRITPEFFAEVKRVVRELADRVGDK